jgi:hypothetical protein
MPSGSPIERLDNPFARRAGASPPPVAPPLALRPMTGYEEEIVEARRNDPNTAALCNEIVARCLVPPGADATEALARTRALFVARRDEALLAIRRMSLGDHVHARIVCPACKQASDIDFRLSDLPVTIRDAPEQIEVVVDGGVRVTLRLPNAGDQQDLLDEGFAGESQRRTWLLSRTMVRYGDREGPFGDEFARALSVGVRNTLEAALEEVIPDLDLSMTVRCEPCGHEFTSPFDIPSFFLPK